MNQPLMHLLRLENYPVYQQLQLEEALLRADDGNWCIINDGAAPAIVMGISGKRELLIDETKVDRDNPAIIRRFSGGGTVIIDENTVLVTFICNSADVHVKCRPDTIMAWTGEVYKKVFLHESFAVRENDYVIGDRKFGGNAQYLCKERWLHHTSLLWDWHPSRMDYLKQPPKMPNYRFERTHHDFLCRLCDFMPDRNQITTRLINELSCHFEIECRSLLQALEITARPHRRATQLETETYNKECVEKNERDEKVLTSILPCR